MGCFSGSTAFAVVTTEPDITNANPQMIAKTLLAVRLSVMGCPPSILFSCWRASLAPAMVDFPYPGAWVTHGDASFPISPRAGGQRASGIGGGGEIALPHRGQGRLRIRTQCDRVQPA